MLLGLEPGFPGQDDRLDKSVLAAAVAILGAGMSFLLAMAFLVFPSWISPRVFATQVRTFVVRANVKPILTFVALDESAMLNATFQQVPTTLTIGYLTQPPDGQPIQAGRLAGAVAKAGGGTLPQESAAMAGSSTGTVAPALSARVQEAGRAIEGLKEEVAGEEFASPTATSAETPGEPAAASSDPSPANDPYAGPGNQKNSSGNSSAGNGNGYGNGYGNGSDHGYPQEKGKGKGKGH